MMIQISGQYGDPKASDYFFPLQKKLNDLFKRHTMGVYFHTLVKLSIVFRVSGKVRDFGSSGAERLKYLKKDSELTIDLAFREDHWKGQDIESIKNKVQVGVNEYLTLLFEKADDLEEFSDKDSLITDLEKVFSEF